jgi:hypothetical protein
MHLVLSSQQQFVVVPQSQLGSVPLKNPEMTAAAHPTPCFTLRAFGLQLISQAPHSMHLSLWIISAFLPDILKTLCGHTSMHILHPMHKAESYSRVDTFLR